MDVGKREKFVWRKEGGAINVLVREKSLRMLLKFCIGECQPYSMVVRFEEKVREMRVNLGSCGNELFKMWLWYDWHVRNEVVQCRKKLGGRSGECAEVVWLCGKNKWGGGTDEYGRVNWKKIDWTENHDVTGLIVLKIAWSTICGWLVWIIWMIWMILSLQYWVV